MKKYFATLIIPFLLSCSTEEDQKRERVMEIIEREIGDKLPLEDIKMCEIENGTGIIIAGSWCYWIDKAGKLFCVNGTSKSIFHETTNDETSCIDAPT